VYKANSQSVLLGFGDYAHAGDIVKVFAGKELRGSTQVKEVDGNLAALMQIFTDEAGEELTFVLQSDAGSIALEPSLTSAPGSITGSYQESVYFMLTEGTQQIPELVTGLSKAYPNPFGAVTNISLDLAKDAEQLKVTIYNLRGQKVRTLLNGKQAKGTIDLEWDGMDANGRRMPAGVYFCRLESAERKQSIKLILIK